jgi:hypothetical protein
MIIDNNHVIIETVEECVQLQVGAIRAGDEYIDGAYWKHGDRDWKSWFHNSTVLHQNHMRNCGYILRVPRDRVVMPYPESAHFI